jgi:putative membrane protein
MLVKNLVSAAVAGLFLGTVGAAQAAAQQPKSLASDSVFIQRASSLGLLQAKLGQLAEKKATSPAVVEFGKRMVAEYSKANEDLKTAAKQAAFPTPSLLREHQQVFDRFQGMGRSSFDKTYMTEAVAQQNEQMQLMKQESSGGRVQSLKELAARMLPDMQQRLTVATQTAGSVGADLTVSTSEGGEKGGTR